MTYNYINNSGPCLLKADLLMHQQPKSIGEYLLSIQVEPKKLLSIEHFPLL